MTQNKIAPTLASRDFAPGIYGVGAWTGHLHFAYDLVATLRPGVLVELGVDRGESYFAFCQSAAENETGTRCFGIDTWCGDQHAGGYDETTFAQVTAHNRANYEAFSTLIHASFDNALRQFEAESIDVLHIDGLHTESAVQHDLHSWMSKVRPGGIILLHDVDVRSHDFGVWKVWETLQGSGRSWTFHEGPGLGVWQRPPTRELPGFLHQLLAPPNEQNSVLAQYYSKRAEELQAKIAQHWRDGTIRDLPSAQQTIIQVFYTNDGVHHEDDAVLARVGHEEWRDIKIKLPPGAEALPLRVDFVSPLTIIEISSIRLIKAGAVWFSATDKAGFGTIALGGDVKRLVHPTALRLQVTGIDPQLYLPRVNLPSSDESLELQMRIQVSSTSSSGW